MKANRFSMLAVAAMAAISCAKELTPDTNTIPDVNQNLVKVSFTATGETAEDDSKAIFSGYPKIAWTADDEISLLGTNTGNQRLTAEAGGHETTFSGYADITDELYYAVYPYDKDATVIDGILSNVTVPAVQTATAGSFDPKAYVAVAQSTDKKTLSFSSVGGFVKFDIKNVEPEIKSITIVSNTGKTMACTASKVTFDNGISHGGTLTNVSTSVKLQGTFDKSKAYFAIVRPQPYAGGVTIYIECEDGRVLARTGNSDLFESGKGRNYIRPLVLDTRYFTEVTDHYTLFDMGYDITIAGKTFNKKDTDATLITASSSSKNITADGLYFVDADVTPNLGSGLSQVAIASRNSAQRASVKRSGGYYKISATSGDDYFILFGIDLTIDPKTASYTIRVEGNETCENIIIDNCAIAVPAATQFIYAASNNYVKNINVTDSEFLVEKNSSNNFIKLDAVQTVESITLDNNVFYSADIAGPSTSFTLISAANITVTDAVINRNTFYGAYPAAGGSNITNCKTTNFTITNNMFGVRHDATKNSNIVAAKISGNMNMSNNGCYVNGTSYVIGGIAGTYAGTGTNNGCAKVGISTNNWNPAEGKFIINANYGATR